MQAERYRNLKGCAQKALPFSICPHQQFLPYQSHRKQLGLRSLYSQNSPPPLPPSPMRKDLRARSPKSVIDFLPGQGDAAVGGNYRAWDLKERTILLPNAKKGTGEPVLNSVHFLTPPHHTPLFHVIIWNTSLSNLEKKAARLLLKVPLYDQAAEDCKAESTLSGKVKGLAWLWTN